MLGAAAQSLENIWHMNCKGILCDFQAEVRGVISLWKPFIILQ